MMDKGNTIIYKEIGASMAILNAGYNITCILTPYQVDYQIPANCFINSYNGILGHPWGRGKYFGRSLTPEETIFFKVSTGTNPQALRRAVQLQSRVTWY